jgi:hypothetical protein
MYCLTSQDRLDETFNLVVQAPRSPKRKGVDSLKKCFEKYKREYMDLEPSLKTTSRKVQVTQCLSYSDISNQLADVPLDVITPATLHVILGITKTIYDGLLKLFSRLEQLEGEKTQGHVSYHLRQSVVDTRDTAKEYVQCLKSKFKNVINTIKGKRKEAAQIVKEIKRVTGKVAAAKLGRQQAPWVRMLYI